MRFFGVLQGGPGAFGIVIPDCPGCTAKGADENEALANAIAALAAWVDDQGADYAPRPSNSMTLRAMPEVARTLGEGGSFIVVPLLREGGQSVKANISLSRGLLEAIDDAAANLGLTRSAFIAAAAREKISRSY